MVLGSHAVQTYLLNMQHNTPCTVAGPPQPAPAPRTAWLAGLTRSIAAIRRSIFGSARVRQLPLGHPDALVDRPGERKIIFGHNVLIIRDRAKD